MNPLGRFAHAVLVMSGIVLAVAGSGETKAAVAGSRSSDFIPATVVLRGSTLDATQPSPVTSNAPIVLRGSPARAVPGPTTGYACPQATTTTRATAVWRRVLLTPPTITATDIGPIRYSTGFTPAAGDTGSLTVLCSAPGEEPRSRLATCPPLASGTVLPI